MNKNCFDVMQICRVMVVTHCNFVSVGENNLSTEHALKTKSLAIIRSDASVNISEGSSCLSEANLSRTEAALVSSETSRSVSDASKFCSENYFVGAYATLVCAKTSKSCSETTLSRACTSSTRVFASHCVANLAEVRAYFSRFSNHYSIFVVD